MTGAPSRSSGNRERLERTALVLMAIGVATMLQPWWEGGMRTGFFVTAACTIAQIVIAHLPEREPEADP